MIDDRTRVIFPASGAVELPLIFAPEVLRCVASGPGGHPLTVLLDTGTDPSAIDLGLARRLDLRLGDFALGSDAASDSVPFTETVLPWLRLGDLTLRDLYAVAMDLSRAPFNVDLVLGYNVLSSLTLSVSYAGRSLSLRHPDIEPPPPGPGGASLPLAFSSHFPALADLRLSCAGRSLDLPLATIDTGSNGALTLGRDLAARVGLYGEADAPEARRGQGFTSGAAVLTGGLADLRLGPFELCDIAIDAPLGGPGDLGRAGRANIGNRLLSRFARVTLDYRRGLCVVDPHR
ncbi:aspartyl protease family protein [Oscillochloris sp. ZM17-4]|uniref:aspartyl protease family protein n=1 Tax=Oscillochloris sp. ZM17-4 TaxID=2866714 RepID=UPI001C72B90E|nr:aspartyl protease family protein [Oscillochloris sp. ZM17-4]MBX0326193.1 aspartyl protease family protein [Oscillochloris sp. ZM17-4]